MIDKFRTIVSMNDLTPPLPVPSPDEKGEGGTQTAT